MVALAGYVRVVHDFGCRAKLIYRKLGASRRIQAVTQARELGLLEG